MSLVMRDFLHGFYDVDSISASSWARELFLEPNWGRI